MTSSTTDLTLTASDIAELAGVGRTTVSNWRSRHKDFPAPVAGSSASPRFNAAEVRAWLKARGKKIHRLPADRAIWAAADRLRGLLTPEEITNITGTLLAWRYVSDPASPAFDPEIPDGSHWPQLQEDPGDLFSRLERGMHAYEYLYPPFRGIFTAVGGAWIEKLRGLRYPGDPLYLLIDALSGLDVDQIGEAYTLLQDRLTTSVRRGYDVHATSDPLVNLVSTLAADIPGPVYDPAVGSGRLLFATGDRGESRTSLTGQEINEASVAQALQRALVTGRTNVTVEQGDTLNRDRFSNLHVPVVVLDPPYGIGVDDLHHYYIDPRLRLGPPSKSTADFAWLQIAMWHLAPGGRAFVILPAADLHRHSAREQAIRIEMLKERAVEAIVALRPGLAHHTSIPLSLWILARPGETADPDSVLLFDQTEAKTPDAEGISTVLRSWRNDGSVPDIDLSAKPIPVAEILASDGDLNPRRWLAEPVAAPDLEAVQESFAELQDAIKAVRCLHVEPVISALGESPHVVSVADLTKALQVETHRSMQRIHEDDYAEDGVALVTSGWIRGSNEDLPWVPLEALEKKPLLTKPGDVVLNLTHPLSARVDHEGGRLLARADHVVIRVLEDVVSPEYLAVALNSGPNQQRIAARGNARVQIEDLRVPILPLDKQRALVDYLKAIDEIRSATHRIARAGESAQMTLINAAMAGTVQLQHSPSVKFDPY